MKYKICLLVMLLMNSFLIYGQNSTGSAKKPQAILSEQSLEDLGPTLKKLVKPLISQAIEKAVKQSVVIYQPQIEVLEYRNESLEFENLALKIGLGVAVVVFGVVYSMK